MEKTITIIEPSGSFGAILSGDESMIDSNVMPEQIAYPGDIDGTLYYADLTDPDNLIIADKVSVPHTITGNVISGLPGDELQVEVSGPISDRFTIPAGETELTFTADVPGQYRLSLSGVKYLPTEVQVAV